ncbi:MAG: hypothetical protein WCF03_06785 [Nitrososphaeraceae archaeon]
MIPAKDRISAERQKVDTIIDILKLESERFSLAQGKQVKNTENDTEETKNNDKRKKVGDARYFPMYVCIGDILNECNRGIVAKYKIGFFYIGYLFTYVFLSSEKSFTS